MNEESSPDFHFSSSLSKILRGTYIRRSKGRVAHSFIHLLLVLSFPSSLIEGPMEGAREMNNIGFSNKCFRAPLGPQW